MEIFCFSSNTHTVVLAQWMTLALNLKDKKEITFISTLPNLLRNSWLPFRPCILDEVAPKADPEIKMWVKIIHMGCDSRCYRGMRNGVKQRRKSSAGCINEQGTLLEK